MLFSTFNIQDQLNRVCFIWFVFVLSVFIVILICFSCNQKKKPASQIIIKKNKKNTLWLNQNKLCPKKLPFCKGEFLLQIDEKKQLPDELSNQVTGELKEKIKSGLYIFTPSESVNQIKYVLPALPDELNQESVATWFSQKILPIVFKNPFFSKKERVIYQKKSWFIQGIQLLHTKCDMNIYLEAADYPIIFVFLWKNISIRDRYLYRKIEKWSIGQFTAVLSGKSLLEEQNEI